MRTVHHPRLQRSRRPSAQLISDAVMANYIHEISVRRGGGHRSPPADEIRVHTSARRNGQVVDRRPGSRFTRDSGLRPAAA